MNRSPSARSPATGRALMSAWNSQCSCPPLVPGRVAVDGCGTPRRHDPQAGGRRRSGTRCRRPSASVIVASSARRDAVGLLRVAVVHEQHVDVARVVELGAAELAHPDDREAEPAGSTMRCGGVEACAGERRRARARPWQVGERRAGRGAAMRRNSRRFHGAAGRRRSRRPRSPLCTSRWWRTCSGVSSTRIDVSSTHVRAIAGSVSPTRVGQRPRRARERHDRLAQEVVLVHLVGQRRGGLDDALDRRTCDRRIGGPVVGRRRAGVSASAVDASTDGQSRGPSAYPVTHASLAGGRGAAEPRGRRSRRQRARILAAYEQAERRGCDLVAFPELAITGYPPEDLLLRPAFVAQAAKRSTRSPLAPAATAAVVGLPRARRATSTTPRRCARTAGC